MVDYSLATIMMPTTLAGSQIGTYVLHSFPPILINIMLTTVLFLLGLQSARKGWQLTKKENEMLRKAAEAESTKPKVGETEELIIEDNDPLNNRLSEPVDRPSMPGDINKSRTSEISSIVGEVPTEEEIEECTALIEREKGHCTQWRK